MQEGTISTSNSTTLPGVSGSVRSWGWYGCQGRDRSGSIARCDARNQPLAIGVLGSVGALEGDLFARWVEQLHDEEQVGVPGGRGDEQPGRHRPGDLGLLGERLGAKDEPVTQRVIGDLRFGVGWLESKGQVGVEVIAGPFRPSDGPFVLAPPYEPFARVSDVELDSGACGPNRCPRP